MAVPKIIHRVWLDSEDGPDPMPDEFVDYGLDWDRVAPHWHRLDWRHADRLPPLRNRDLFDRAREVCPRDWIRFRSDLVRLELLWLYGGAYVDTDVRPLRPFDDLLPGRTCILGWSPNPGPDGTYPATNAVMVAAPGHPFIGACIDRLPADVERHAGRHLAVQTGPWLLTRELREGDWDDTVDVLPSSTFYPQSIVDRDAGQTADLDGAYCWHRWANTRDNRRGGLA